MTEHKIARRRTLAIISHPDAGKTTLTEKFLLYGGAVHMAGSVRARKNQRTSTSDWMELERQRGISISSTVLQFDYRDWRVNLLDTPGHRDFSEDTYRVLMAVDAVIMVLDGAAGIESQTRKLFEVCRRRSIPIFTFVNKMDRPTLEPLALLDQLEEVLGMEAFPVNWPLGTGADFKGVYDRLGRRAYLYRRQAGGATQAPVSIHPLSDPAVRGEVTSSVWETFTEELELLDATRETFEIEALSAGRMTPVFFGSAVYNFGVDLLLDQFLTYAPSPQPRESRGLTILPQDSRFTGFIFKIQANLDPRHRDRVAFLRVCSGRFDRNMLVTHTRSGKEVRLANSTKIFGRERATLDEAYPGDVVGLVGHSEFRVGDTLSEDPAVSYEEIPRFSPECFAYFRPFRAAGAKSFRKGLAQLLEEGVVQAFHLRNSAQRVPLLAAVGPLQFDVVRYRLENEYGVECEVSTAPWRMVRWIGEEVDSEALEGATGVSGMTLAEDTEERAAILFPDEWSCNYFMEKNPRVRLTPIPLDSGARTPVRV
jgi:peptide chain release factor 3